MVKKKTTEKNSAKAAAKTAVPVVKKPKTLSDWYEYSWGKYADFSGRASRTEFWSFYLTNGLIFILMAMMEALFSLYFIFTTMYALIIILPVWSVYARRFHDIGRSSWVAFTPHIIFYLWMTIEFIRVFLLTIGYVLMPPVWIYYLYIILFWAMFIAAAGCFGMLWIKGDQGDNKYGPMPRF